MNKKARFKKGDQVRNLEPVFCGLTGKYYYFLGIVRTIIPLKKISFDTKLVSHALAVRRLRGWHALPLS